jgi:predicted DNA-binding WGR domain protein
MTRTFEYKDAKSAKFWEVTTEHLLCTVRFGKIDTAGQSQSKHFPDNEAAEQHGEKLIAEKLRKGYTETK